MREGQAAVQGPLHHGLFLGDGFQGGGTRSQALGGCQAPEPWGLLVVSDGLSEWEGACGDPEGWPHRFSSLPCPV